MLVFIPVSLRLILLATDFTQLQVRDAEKPCCHAVVIRTIRIVRILLIVTMLAIMMILITNFTQLQVRDGDSAEPVVHELGLRAR